MKYLILIIALVSCATYNEPYKGNVSIDRVFDTAKSKSQMYDSSLSFFAKYMNDSNSAIKMRERESGRIVVKIMDTCDLTMTKPKAKSNNFGKQKTKNKTVNINMGYIVDIQAKNNKAKMTIEMDKQYNMLMLNGQMRPFNILTTDSQQGNINKCLNRLAEYIIKNVTKKTKDW
jgi:hypothetical protein